MAKRIPPAVPPHEMSCCSVTWENAAGVAAGSCVMAPRVSGTRALTLFLFGQCDLTRRGGNDHFTAFEFFEQNGVAGGQRLCAFCHEIHHGPANLNAHFAAHFAPHRNEDAPHCTSHFLRRVVTRGRFVCDRTNRKHHEPAHQDAGNGRKSERPRRGRERKERNN